VNVPSVRAIEFKDAGIKERNSASKQSLLEDATHGGEAGIYWRGVKSHKAAPSGGNVFKGRG